MFLLFQFAEFDQVMRGDPNNLLSMVKRVEQWLISKRWRKVIYGAICVQKCKYTLNKKINLYPDCTEQQRTTQVNCKVWLATLMYGSTRNLTQVEMTLKQHGGYTKRAQLQQRKNDISTKLRHHSFIKSLNCEQMISACR